MRIIFLWSQKVTGECQNFLKLESSNESEYESFVLKFRTQHARSHCDYNIEPRLAGSVLFDA